MALSVGLSPGPNPNSRRSDSSNLTHSENAKKFQRFPHETTMRNASRLRSINLAQRQMSVRFRVHLGTSGHLACGEENMPKQAWSERSKEVSFCSRAWPAHSFHLEPVHDLFMIITSLALIKC